MQGPTARYGGGSKVSLFEKEQGHTTIWFRLLFVLTKLIQTHLNLCAPSPAGRREIDAESIEPGTLSR